MRSILKPNPERMRLKGDLDGLLRLLKGKTDNATRREAILALGRMQTPAAVKDLITLFQDPDPDIRCAASEALVTIGKEAYKPLICALSTTDEQTARMVHTTLCNTGDDGAREIIKKISDLQGIGYERAGYVLYSMGTRIIPLLIDALAVPDQTQVRFIEGLLETFGRSSIQPLIKGLSHDNEEVRARVSAILIILGEQVVGDLLTSCAQDDEQLRELKFYIISEIGKPALDPMYYALKDPNPVTSSMAQKAFLEFGESAIVPLIRGLYDTDSEIRKVSEYALTRIGEPVVPHLVAELYTRRADEAEPVSSVISHIGEPAIPYLIEELSRTRGDNAKKISSILTGMGVLSIPYLINSVKSQSDTENIEETFLSMGRIAFPFLEESVERERGKSAVFLVNLLRKIDPVRSVDSLVSSLYHQDKDVRETALENLVEIGETAVPRLVQVLGSSDEEAVNLARIALERNGELAVPHLIDTLYDQMGPDHTIVLEILKENPGTAIPHLIPALAGGKEGHDEALSFIMGYGMESVPYLVESLQTAGPDLFNSIISILQDLFRKEPDRFIEDLLSGESLDTGIVYKLLSTSPDDAISSLIRIFQGDDSSKSLFAGELLSMFGKTAIDPFISALRKEPDDDRKLEITSFLIKIGPDAIPDLVPLLGDPDMAPYAMAALSSIGEPAVPALLPLLKNPDDLTRQYAVMALTRIGSPAALSLTNLMNEDESLVPLISRILADMGGSALPDLLKELKELKNQGQEGSSRGLAVMSLITEIALSSKDDLRQLFTLRDPVLTSMFERIFISRGEAIIGPVLDAVSDEPEIPDMAAAIFSSMRPRTLAAVKDRIRGISPGDHRLVPMLKILGIFRDPDTASIIFDSLKDPEQDVRMTAIRELGKFGREALGPLTEAMQDEDPQVRAAAVESLGNIGLPVLDQLISALKDPDGNIRAAAINGIAKIGEPGQFMLVQSLDDPDRQVRQAVLKLLEESGWQPKYTTDRLSYLFAAENFEELIKIGPPSVDILARGLHDTDPDIREKSREALAIIRDSIKN